MVQSPLFEVLKLVHLVESPDYQGAFNKMGLVSLEIGVAQSARQSGFVARTAQDAAPGAVIGC
jgi:hypothetical protein